MEITVETPLGRRGRVLLIYGRNRTARAATDLDAIRIVGHPDDLRPMASALRAEIWALRLWHELLAVRLKLNHNVS
jgi:hypothetical protein